MNSSDHAHLGAFAAYNDLAECLLHELRLINYGYSAELIFNLIRPLGGAVRRDVLLKPHLLSVELHGVHALALNGALTPAMLAHPENINWGLSEIARVQAWNENERFFLKVLWEGERNIQIECQKISVKDLTSASRE